MIHSNAGRKILTLQPPGVNRLPVNIQELVDVLVCVATALRDLHSLMLCHTDLRWSNVVRVLENVWYLIDCTNFVRVGVNASSEDMTFASSRYRTEYRLNEFPYSIKHDLYQVGKLAECCGNLLDDGLDALISMCLNGAYGNTNDLLQHLLAR